MTKKTLPAAFVFLQWALGLVILQESLRFALSDGAAREFARTGLPNFIRLVLAWSEIAAAALFLVPRTMSVGGWFLVVVLGCAIVLHILHGWFDVGALLVYAVATWAVMAARRSPIFTEGEHEW
jgi:hypothetical protein